MILGKSVRVFDKIQLGPKARQAIKHLVKGGRCEYIETRSLISIKINVKDIIIPRKETNVFMYPLDFEEFLWAISKNSLYDLIAYPFQNLDPLGEAVNRNILKECRFYMLVGGMPQAVLEY